MRGILGNEICNLVKFEEVQQKLEVPEELYLYNITIKGDDVIIELKEKKTSDDGKYQIDSKKTFSRSVSLNEFKKMMNLEFSLTDAKVLLKKSKNKFVHLWIGAYTSLPNLIDKLYMAFTDEHQYIEPDLYFREIKD